MIELVTLIRRVTTKDGKALKRPLQTPKLTELAQFLNTNQIAGTPRLKRE